jgi:plasmid segregation protein ParM
MGNGMKCLGFDCGYGECKDHFGNIFKSTYSTYDSSVSGSNALEINGKKYYVGVQNGVGNVDVDRTNSDLSMVCHIYDIILNNIHDVCLSVGLPVGHYVDQKNSLVENIMSFNKLDINYGGSPYKLKIHDVFVCRQGISSLYCLPELDGAHIVTDFGSLTIDTSLVEFTKTSANIITSTTQYKGLKTLYSDVIQAVNNHFGTKLDNEYADKIFKHGLRINGKDADISFLKPILQNYIDSISEHLKLKFPVDNAPIYMCGGATELLYPSFTKRFNDVHKIANPQFSNCVGYSLIGNYKFKQRGLI